MKRPFEALRPVVRGIVRGPVRRLVARLVRVVLGIAAALVAVLLFPPAPVQSLEDRAAWCQPGAAVRC